MGLIDLMPTIATLAGLAVPEAYVHDGEPVDVAGDLELKNRAILSETRMKASLQAVTFNGYKFIHNLETKKHQLFDLGDDPAESQDVIIGHVEMTAYLEGILEELNTSMMSQRANLKVKRPRYSKEEMEHFRALGYIE
jgi:hypothetical protein